MRRTPKETPVNGRGSIHADEVIPLAEFGRRMNLASRAQSDAQKSGLRTILFGRVKFVLGSDVLEWFGKLAEEQAEVPQ